MAPLLFSHRARGAWLPQEGAVAETAEDKKRSGLGDSESSYVASNAIVSYVCSTCRQNHKSGVETWSAAACYRSFQASLLSSGTARTGR